MLAPGDDQPAIRDLDVAEFDKAVGLSQVALQLVDNLVKSRIEDTAGQREGDPGQDILIVAIDEKSQQVLGDWPWAMDPYARLFERLKGARVIGFGVLLSNAGSEGNPDTVALIRATREAGNVILPLIALELLPPQSPGSLYVTGRTIRSFPALLDVADGDGSVEMEISVLFADIRDFTTMAENLPPA